MKKILVLLTLILVSASAPSVVRAQTSPAITYFYGEGCTHCANVSQFFTKTSLESKINVVKKEIYGNRDNALYFNNLMDELGVPVNERGVPTLVAGSEVITGDKPIIQWFSDNYGDKLSGPSVSMDDGEQEIPAPEAFVKTGDFEELITTVANEVEVVEQDAAVAPVSKRNSLTIFSVVAASVVDAVNPCAFAVLIILMTTVLAGGNGKRALHSGLAFSASIFISYLLMGLGLYTALSLGNFSHAFFKIIGWLAIIVGLLNLKDWLWYGKGFLMEVPLSWRPKMKTLIKSVASPAGAFGVGFLVSLFLLPCTSGPYIVILGMLSQKEQFVSALSYLILYNAIFVLPMILITYAVYKGFNPSKAEEIRQKRLKTLHFVAGVLMITVGVVVLMGWL